MNFTMIPRLLFALLAFAILGGCATNPVTGEQDFVLMSEQDELALGRETHEQILQQYSLYDDMELQAYVSEIGERLGQFSHRSELNYRFHVLDSTEVNAFALPGGYIYISRGLIAYMNSEAELAAVLGHEIGHVTARHSVRQHSATTATQVLGSLIAAGTGVQGADDLANIAGTALVRGYGREHELEADRLGAEYLARAGYDPEAMIQVVRILKNQELFERERAREEGREPRTYHGLFATHPDNDTRLQQVVGAAKQYASTGTGAQNRDRFLEHIDGMTFGPGAGEGVIIDNTFYHTALDFALRFPADWSIDNRSDRLIGTSNDRTASLLLMLQPLASNQSPQQFVKDELGLRLNGARKLTINGLRGFAGTAAGHLFSDGQPRQVTVIAHGGNAYIFAATGSTPAALKQNRERLGKIVRSFHRLNKSEREKARPLRIDLVRARQGQTFRQLAVQSPLREHAEQQLRLVNDRYPSGEIIAGETVKIVR